MSGLLILCLLVNSSASGEENETRVREWKFGEKVFREEILYEGDASNGGYHAFLSLPNGKSQSDWWWGKYGHSHPYADKYKENFLHDIIKTEHGIYAIRRHSVELWDDKKGLIEVFRVSTKEREFTLIEKTTFRDPDNKIYFVVRRQAAFCGLLTQDKEKWKILPYKGSRMQNVVKVQKLRKKNLFLLVLENHSDGSLERVLFDSIKKTFTDI